MKTSQKQFLGEYVQQQRQIKQSNAIQERKQNKQQYEEQDNYYDEDYDDDGDDMPGLEDAEGNSPGKSPRKNQNNIQIKGLNLGELSNIENSKKKEQQQQQQLFEIQQEQKEEEEEESINFNDDFLEDSPREYYPRIQNYLPGGQNNQRGSEHFVQLNEKDSMRADEEIKIIEKYLNKVFPEFIQSEQELADEQIILQQIDKNTKLKNLLPKKIASLDIDIWREPQLKKELKQQYNDQALYLSKINMLYSDKLILHSNIKEKEKKIKEIQRVLRDLNDKKLEYLDKHNAEKIDLIELKYKEINLKEVTELSSKLAQSEKERDLYKLKFDVYKDKYESIMKEANETKHVIQDQIKELLNYKMSLQAKGKKMDEDLKKNQEEKKLNSTEFFHSKIRQKNQKSLGSSFNNFNQQITTSEENQPALTNSQQNINIQGLDKQAAPFLLGGLSQSNIQQSSSSQKQNQYASFQKVSPPNTPPLNSNQVPLSPIMTPLSNPTIGNDYIIGQSIGISMNNQQYAIGQSQKNKNNTNYDTDNSENNNNNNLFAQQQSTLTSQIGGNNQNADNKKSTQMIPLSLESISAYQQANNQSDSKKQKKPQVQFEDLVKSTLKPQDQEQNDYYNQLCASKIKNMVKAIQLSHPQLIEESSFHYRK